MSGSVENFRIRRCRVRIADRFSGGWQDGPQCGPYVKARFSTEPSCPLLHSPGVIIGIYGEVVADVPIPI
jgi:hypothetical protein